MWELRARWCIAIGFHHDHGNLSTRAVNPPRKIYGFRNSVPLETQVKVGENFRLLASFKGVWGNLLGTSDEFSASGLNQRSKVLSAVFVSRISTRRSLP